MRESWAPDLEGVARAARVAFVSFAVACKRRLSPWILSLSGAPER